MKRTRTVLVESQAGPQSQPATDGGSNGYWPMLSSSQLQSSRLMNWRVERSEPATNTSGHFTIVGELRLAYSFGWARIAATSGLIFSPEPL